MEGKVEAKNITLPSVVQAGENQSKNSQEKANDSLQTVTISKERSTAGLFITPVLQFDSEALSVIFQVRDGISGEVKQEYPQESVVKGREQKPANNTIQTVSVETSVVGSNAPAAMPEKATQGTNGVDLNTATAESNGSSATASTTAGIATGLGT
jgi:hypothetical protein